MGRLIDADVLIDLIESEYGASRVAEVGIIKVVEDSPTAYNVDAVVEQLENEKQFWETSKMKNPVTKGKAVSYHHSIEIVKGGGVDGRKA